MYSALAETARNAAALAESRIAPRIPQEVRLAMQQATRKIKDLTKERNDLQQRVASLTSSRFEASRVSRSPPHASSGAAGAGVSALGVNAGSRSGSSGPLRLAQLYPPYSGQSGSRTHPGTSDRSDTRHHNLLPPVPQSRVTDLFGSPEGLSEGAEGAHHRSPLTPLVTRLLSENAKLRAQRDAARSSAQGRRRELEPSRVSVRRSPVGGYGAGEGRRRGSLPDPFASGTASRVSAEELAQIHAQTEATLARAEQALQKCPAPYRHASHPRSAGSERPGMRAESPLDLLLNEIGGLREAITKLNGRVLSGYGAGSRVGRDLSDLRGAGEATLREVLQETQIELHRILANLDRRTARAGEAPRHEFWTHETFIQVHNVIAPIASKYGLHMIKAPYCMSKEFRKKAHHGPTRTYSLVEFSGALAHGHTVTIPCSELTALAHEYERDHHALLTQYMSLTEHAKNGGTLSEVQITERGRIMAALEKIQYLCTQLEQYAWGVERRALASGK